MRKYSLTRRAFLQQASAFAAAGALAACSGPTATTAPSVGSDATQVPAAPAGGEKEVAPGVLRSDCLILENPQGRVVPADDFNRWRPGIQSASTGLQQIGLDALWYIDPDAGIDGVWDNALAAEKPIYNKDFTQMTVKLRKGIFWSDGVEFTADDLIYTVDVQKKTTGMAYTGQFSTYVDKMEKPDNYTVVFTPDQTQLPLPRPVHRPLGRLLHDAEACLRKAGRCRRVQVQPAGQPWRHTPSRISTPTATGTSGSAAKTGRRRTLARFGEPGPQVRHVHRPRPERQEGHGSDVQGTGRHPRHRSRRHDHARQDQPDLAWLVQVIPVGASRSDAARGHLQ